MDEAARVLLADLGLDDFVDKLESLGVLALPDIDVLLQADLAELGMTRVQIRRLQQATRHLEIRPKKTASSPVRATYRHLPPPRLWVPGVWLLLACVG